MMKRKPRERAAGEAHSTEWLREKRTAKNRVNECIAMHRKKDTNFPHTVMGYEQMITTQNLDLEI